MYTDLLQDPPRKTTGAKNLPSGLVTKFSYPESQSFLTCMGWVGVDQTLIFFYSNLFDFYW